MIAELRIRKRIVDLTLRTIDKKISCMSEVAEIRFIELQSESEVLAKVIDELEIENEKIRMANYGYE